jgi:GNAT superfamily N-acetyltransferase
MRIMQWDESDQDILDGCFQVDTAAQVADDPLGPPSTPDWLRLSLTATKGSDRKETWVAIDDSAGSGSAGSGSAGRDSAGRVLGWYSLRLTDRENRHAGFLMLTVHPDRRRHGIGTALLRHAARRAAADSRTVLGGEAFEGGAGDAFAKRIGAKSGVLEARRLLDVAAIPPGKVAALRAEAAAAAAGYSLLSWTGPVPEDRVTGYAYVRQAMNDAPSDYEGQRWDEERVRSVVNPRIVRSGHRRYTIVAIHDATGQTAAFTELGISPEAPDWGFQDNTGVARPHRGNRLGLLVKAAMLEWLAETEPNVRKIVTWNAAINNHMVSINERIGFEVFHPWVQDYEIPVTTVLE